LPGVSRGQLESERVRYLSREERLSYLVKIDKEGRLCWAKNGARIDTTTKYKDSIHGIVPASDITSPRWAAPAEEAAPPQGSSTSSSESDNETHDDESIRAARYTTPELDKAKGYKKVKHVSAATVFNKLLRGSVKKNTWIFVADTSFRLYVGIKVSVQMVYLSIVTNIWKAIRCLSALQLFTWKQNFCGWPDQDQERKT
jgi:hypothetical protein